MSEPVKKLQWGYTGMIPFSETAEKLGLHAYVQIENYQFMQKRADNLESENARLKAEVERLKMEESKLLTLCETYEGDLERLRKAGDAMADWFTHNDCRECSKDCQGWLPENWNAAKEGKPSV